MTSPDFGCSPRRVTLRMLGDYGVTFRASVKLGALSYCESFLSQNAALVVEESVGILIPSDHLDFYTA